ncbi:MULTISPECIES: replication initiator [Ferrimicrobium]|uniref:replication initiator n=1 Tax=Ferrimicrobium TaxID=121038 RepID=UPI0023F27B88|nr:MULTISPECIES: replication initiator [Ferrimicrobium]
MQLSQPLIDQIVVRAADGYEELGRAARGARYCRRPIRLASTPLDPGQVTGFFEDEAPSSLDFDGVYFKACGTRRRTLCESCSRIYQGDARQLIRSGLLGGKGVPEEIATHPAIFVTLTAPSFGSVHRPTLGEGVSSPCHPNSTGTCQHGRKLGCWTRHDESDDIVGAPLCDECYDFSGAVIWNAASTKLWQRTTIYLRRALAKIVGVTAKELSAQVGLSYVKVIEYQRRGLIHLHVVVRIDDSRDMILAPGIVITAEQVALALRMAAAKVKVCISAGEMTHTVAWGTQLDTRVIDADSTAAIANYIAKYAIKSASDSPGLDRRFRTVEAIEDSRAPKHLLAMARAAFELGENPDYKELNLARWAHDLGHRGHFLTKSRRFSVTFAYLRGMREAWRDMERLERAEALDPRFEETSELYFVGQGWPFACDVYLVGQQRNEYDDARACAKDQIEEELHQGGQR